MTNINAIHVESIDVAVEANGHVAVAESGIDESIDAVASQRFQSEEEGLIDSAFVVAIQVEDAYFVSTGSRAHVEFISEGGQTTFPVFARRPRTVRAIRFGEHKT